MLFALLKARFFDARVDEPPTRMKLPVSAESPLCLGASLQILQRLQEGAGDAADGARQGRDPSAAGRLVGQL